MRSLHSGGVWGMRVRLLAEIRQDVLSLLLTRASPLQREVEPAGREF